MAYRRGFDRGKRQVIVDGNAEPSGDLNTLFNTIFAVKREHDDRARRLRKTRKRNERRESR